MTVNVGSLLIDVEVGPHEIRAVKIELQRARVAAQIQGLAMLDAVRLLPILHSLCARAHAAAAAAATSAAAGSCPAPSIDRDVASEAAREHLMSVMTGAARAALPEAFRALNVTRELRELLDGALLGIPTEQWLGFSSTAELLRWADLSDSPLAQELRARWRLPEPSASAIRTLPILLATATLDHWTEIPPGFSTRPNWLGCPAEVGPIAREESRPLLRELKDRPLLQRWVARVVELARYACGDPAVVLGQVSAVTVASGGGRSVVETARGMLMHEVEISNDRVARYRIIAPTEWNFHPDGPLRRWLEGLPVGSLDLARDMARRAAEALDPCVEFRCVVR